MFKEVIIGDLFYAVKIGYWKVTTFELKACNYNSQAKESHEREIITKDNCHLFTDEASMTAWKFEANMRYSSEHMVFTNRIEAHEFAYQNLNKYGLRLKKDLAKVRDEIQKYFDLKSDMEYEIFNLKNSINNE
jgi:hypothetical protein